MNPESTPEREERLEKLTVEKEDGRLLTYYRFVPSEPAEEFPCPS